MMTARLSCSVCVEVLPLEQFEPFLLFFMTVFCLCAEKDHITVVLSIRGLDKCPLTLRTMGRYKYRVIGCKDDNLNKNI